MIIPDIRQAARLLGGDAYGRNRISCPGPGHGRNDRSLSIKFTDDGFICESFAGDDWKECRDHIKAALGLSDDRPAPIVAPEPDYAALISQKRRIDAAARIWGETVPLHGTLAERYLSSRGITYDGEALRYHPGQRLMVAMMSDAVTGEPCGIHRTFLDPDGKKVDRKMLGRAAGAVVRLAEDAAVTYGLGIAEGIETALRAPFWPMWACLSASTMKAMPVLAGITSLSIFADQDKAGLTAANECGQRWHAAGVEVTMAAPLSGDFADIREAA